MDSFEASDEEQFFSLLGELCCENGPGNTSLVIKINSFPLAKRLQLLIHVLGSNHPHNLKESALYVLEKLCTELLDNNELSFDNEVTKVRVCIFQLLTLPQLESQQHKLLAISASVIGIVNRHKENKWETIMELVSSCVTPNKPKLYIYLSNFLRNRFELFGDDEQQRCEQYNLFFMECLKNPSSRPELALLAIEVLHGLSVWLEGQLAVRIFSSLVPSIATAMESITSTNYGLDFVENMHHLLEFWEQIFSGYSQLIMKTLNRILDQSNVEESMLLKIYLWAEEFITYFGYDVANNCPTEITRLVNNLLDFQLNSYPNDPEQWFQTKWGLNDTLITYENNRVQSCLKAIIASVGSKIMYPILLERMERCFDSSDWKRIDSGIQIVGVLTHCSEPNLMIEPDEILKKLSPYFFHQNPKIVYSTVKMMGVLCYTFFQKEFYGFHKKVLSLTLEGATKQNHLHIKLLAINAVDNIVTHCYYKQLDVNFDRTIQFFVDVVDFILKCNDVELTLEFTNAIISSFDSIYKIRNLVNQKEFYGMAENIFKIMDKIMFMPKSSYKFHCLIDCLYKIASHNYSQDDEFPIELILKLVKNFNISHRLSLDGIEIRPCFFSLLGRLIQHKSKSLLKISTMLGSSALKLLSNIAQVVRNLNENDLREFLEKPVPYGCVDCISNKYVGIVDWICTFVVLLIENNDIDNINNMEVFRYNETCLKILVDILIGAADKTIYLTTAEGLYRLVDCAIVHGDMENIVNLWGSELKEGLLNSIVKSPFPQMHKMIDILRKCITIPGFENPINSTDIRCIGAIINNIVIELTKNNEQALQLENNKERKNANTIKILKSWIIDDYLNNLRRFIHDILNSNQECTISVIIQLFKTLLPHLKNDKWKSFFKFLLYIVEDILELKSLSVSNYNDILPIILNFTFDVLLITSDEAIKNKITIISEKLKAKYPKEFDTHFEKLDTISKTIILEKIKIL